MKETKNKSNYLVYVLDINGEPLMPTSRCGKVRRMLNAGKAKVVNLMPFTIQLLYEPETHVVDKLKVGIDPGSKHMGISVCSEKKELYRSETLMESGMKDRIDARRAYRMSRRNRKTRYRKPRFNNRKASKKKGWLAPSVLRLSDAHIKMIKNLFKFLPLNKETTVCVIEICDFDTQKLKNPNISGVEYQLGDLYGFENRRMYVLARDGYKCQICNAKSKDKRLEVHHIQYRRDGGTDDVNNLITLCADCHHKIHSNELKLKKKHIKSYRDAAKVSSMKTRLFADLKSLFNNVEITYGYITKRHRIEHEIPKSHDNDAFTMCQCYNAVRLNYHYVFMQTRRHNRSLHEATPKKNGNRKSTVAPKYLPNGFMRYDKVYCKSLDVYGFIYGSSNGYAVLKDINGNKLIKSTITTKKLQLVYRKHGGFMVDMVKYRDSDI